MLVDQRLCAGGLISSLLLPCSGIRFLPTGDWTLFETTGSTSHRRVAIDAGLGELGPGLRVAKGGRLGARRGQRRELRPRTSPLDDQAVAVVERFRDQHPSVVGSL